MKVLFNPFFYCLIFILSLFLPQLISLCALPPLDFKERGVIISGKIPYWLLTGAARLFPAAPWLAVYQASLNQAVVIASQIPPKIVGQTLPVTLQP